MRRLFVCIAVAALASTSVQIASSQNQKEVRVNPHHGDGGPGEQTSLEALVGLSDAVVVGRVFSARPSNITPTGTVDDAGTFFSTAYSLKIEQVLQWSKPLGTQPASLEMEMWGVGDVDRGSYIERHASERYRELASDRTYTLFIRKYALGRPADARLVWVPATGDGQSIIEIRNGNVAPQATTRLALNLAALSPTALFDKIKQLPAGGRHEAAHDSAIGALPDSRFRSDCQFKIPAFR